MDKPGEVCREQTSGLPDHGEDTTLLYENQGNIQYQLTVDVVLNKWLYCPLEVILEFYGNFLVVRDIRVMLHIFY